LSLDAVGAKDSVCLLERGLAAKELRW
jgi:hypothetical protein